jgi:predicted site-specific integrase-resolvase
MKSGLMTPKQARERFNVSGVTLYRWRKAGLITEYRLPTTKERKNSPCRYDPEEIEKLLKSEG